MILTRINPEFCQLNFKSSKTFAFLWGSDGMCYIPELKQRRSYFLQQGLLKVEIQPWEGVLPSIEHSERVEVLQSEKPLAFREKFLHYDDLYVEKDPSHSSTST